MITLKLSAELWRFTLLIAILFLYKSVYRLVAQLMDFATSTPSKTSHHTHPCSPDSTSPRLSSFPPRFLQSASNPTSDNMPGTETKCPSLVAKSEAARSAKHFVLSTVRDDWSYPSPGPQPVPEPMYREPVHYRRRVEGSSDPEHLSDEPHDARDPIAFTSSDPYKFENPEAIARTVVERKRKRRRLFREELEWNDGLRTWVDCRNAWCGAVRQRPKKRRTQISYPKENICRHSVATDGSPSISPLSEISGTSSSPFRPDSDSENDGQAESLDDDQDPLLPVYPPLLPGDNSIRASIKPTMYPAIYSKVVLQSLTPTVPVPLPDIIGALVQGWKSEGNWPPKGAAPTTSTIQGGGRRASQLLSFRRRENVMAETGRMRKGVGAVRRALGLGAPNGEMDGLQLDFAPTEMKRTWSIDQAGLMQEDSRPPG